MSKLKWIALLLGLTWVAGVTAPRVATLGKGERPSLAADAQGRLHLVYEGMQAGKDIYYRRSEDGQTWSAESNLSNTPGLSTAPALALEKSGAVDVVWAEAASEKEHPDIYFARSTDGQAWSPAVDISNTPGISRSPSVAVGAHDSIHVVWADNSKDEKHPDIYYVFSYNAGRSWSKPRNISNTPGASSQPVAAAGPDGVIHVAWADTSSGEDHRDIYYTRGESDHWSPSVDVSNTLGLSSQPALAVSPGNQLYLAWVDTTGHRANPDILLLRSDAEGHFGKQVDASNTPGISSDPALACDGKGHAVVAWADTSAGSKAPDIWLTRSGDTGKSWSRASDISNTQGLSRLPSVAIGRGNAWVVWEEQEKGSSWLKLTSVKL